ncbi:MAG: helix-turn-helix domain-containing protein [Xenococcus sp. (in: cyanobacteria)]
MYVHTTQAASLLGISSRRLRQLSQQGRIKGAYKSGKFWLIPLYNGLPQVTKAKRGQAGTWKTTKQPKKTIVHINSNKIKQNIKKSSEEREPVIAIKGTTNTYVHQLEIPAPCRVVYQPDKPLSCGAKVWIEILGCEIALIQPSANIDRRAKIFNRQFS